MAGNKSFANNSTAQIAAVTLSAGGTFSIAGVAGQSIAVLYIFLEVTTGGTLAFGHGTGPTEWTGTMTVPTGQFGPLDHHDNPLITAPGEQFIITSVASTVAAGYIMYTQGDA